MVTADKLSQPSREKLKVAWITDYPIEWLADLPASLRSLNRQHPATWLRVLLQEFQHRGDVEVHAFALRSRISQSVTFEQHGTTFHVLKASRAGRLFSLFWLDVWLLRRQLKIIQPDLVHAWGTERGAALVASRLGRPYLLTMQGLLTWVVRAIPSLPLFMKFMALLEPLALQRARVATCESSFAVKYLGNRYPQLQIQQAEHAPGRAFVKTQRNTLRPGIQILAVGTMGVGKGTDLLLKALDALRPEFNFSLTLVGGGSPEFMTALQQNVSPELWGRVTIKHGLTPEAVAAEMAQATLFAHPTLVDNSPNSVKEAVVVGVPVVASEVGGIPDYIRHDRNGLLFPAGDQAALTRTLRAAMTHPLFGQGRVDPQTWEEMRDYLSPERMAKNFLAAYQLVLNARQRPESSV